MAEKIARYDIYESPCEKGNKKKKSVHARVVTTGTIKTHQLAELIANSSSVTPGDVEAVLSNLAYVVSIKLAEGERVHIEGLGYFQMTLSCKKTNNKKEIKGNDVKFRSVSFRPEKNLKVELEKTRFLRSEKRNIHSLTYSEKEMETLLTEYFKENSYITRSSFEQLLILTRSTAGNRINKLVKEGRLVKEGIARSPFYVPAKGYYGK